MRQVKSEYTLALKRWAAPELIRFKINGEVVNDNKFDFRFGLHDTSDEISDETFPSDVSNLFYNAVSQLVGISEVERESILSFLSQPIVNQHGFSYLHNPRNACREQETEVLFVVPSAPDHFKLRSRKRRGSYGRFVNDKANRVRLVFFLGRTDSAELQRTIDDESNRFHDIVQESYPDHYNNIRMKAVSMLRWASKFCVHADYVIRNDDDINVNVLSVIDLVKKKHAAYDNFILGRVRKGDKPARRINSKAYLSFREYPHPTLPPFAIGGLLGYPMLTVQLLYQAALRVPPIWLDDVYITGFCAPKVGAKLLADDDLNFTHKSHGY
ncbi:Beta-1,3-galactosyltransferase 1 [Bulinus truncatus]|nr:Beta-1,3-galactosyltransferase 1 [Bulinus truncatus]